MNALLAQSDWAILLMRLALGLIFIAHGWKKVKGFPGTVKWLKSEGFKPATFWAFLLSTAEFGGGILILVGLFTQIAALVLTINMMVAFVYNYRKKASFFGKLELDIILIAALLLIATLGDGFYSLNGLFGITL